MKKQHAPVMILAGGLGTRLREETEFRPKPMVPVGGKPILWHIMKIYASYGYYKFIICLGYKGDMIKNYFLNYRFNDINFTINTKTGTIIEHQVNEEEWEITLVDTGQNCLTGGRVARAAHYVNAPYFLLTYGDGVADVNINQLVEFHQSHGKMATVTGVNLPSRFGHLQTEGNQITSFAEKRKISDEWVNGGFFVLQKDFMKYLSPQGNCTLEQEPLKDAALDGQLMMYKHYGFWQCMDTVREHQQLEELWKTTAPWKTWADHEQEFKPAVKSTLRQTNQEL